MTESLFFTGNKMKQDLDLSPFDEIVFSDSTQSNFITYQSGIRFTKEMLFFCYNHIKLDFDDWNDWETIEVCPWENIISIDTYDGINPIRSISHKDIRSWLSHFKDTQLSFPYLKITSHNITIIMEGRPFSERSKNQLRRQNSLLQTIIPNITSVVKNPLTIQTSLYIDVFTTQRSSLPDVDRFVHPIMDIFRGILYKDDSQINTLHPRIFNIENPFTILECRSDPMSLSFFENIPVGSLLPLVIDVRDYYVIRFRIQ